MKKKKLKRTRVTKKDIAVQRKLHRRKKEEKQTSSGSFYSHGQYLLSIAAIKRSLVQLAEKIKFLLMNYDGAKKYWTPMNNAHDYLIFAWDWLSETEINCVDTAPKTKLHRRKKKGKLNRRKS